MPPSFRSHQFVNKFLAIVTLPRYPSAILPKPCPAHVTPAPNGRRRRYPRAIRRRGARTRALPVIPAAPQRALRARTNALLVTLYERSSLTLREIAALAGRTDRAVQMLVRELGCRPRNAGNRRPGIDRGVRRTGLGRMPASPKAETPRLTTGTGAPDNRSRAGADSHLGSPNPRNKGSPRRAQ